MTGIVNVYPDDAVCKWPIARETYAKCEAASRGSGVAKVYNVRMGRVLGLDADAIESNAYSNIFNLVSAPGQLSTSMGSELPWVFGECGGVGVGVGVVGGVGVGVGVWWGQVGEARWGGIWIVSHGPVNATALQNHHPHTTAPPPSLCPLFHPSPHLTLPLFCPSPPPLSFFHPQRTTLSVPWLLWRRMRSASSRSSTRRPSTSMPRRPPPSSQRPDSATGGR